MPPTLRPRPPPLAGEKKTSAVTTRQVQPNRSLGSKRARKVKENHNDQQAQSSKGKQPKRPRPSQTSKVVEKTKQSRPPAPATASQTAEQLRPRKSEQTQRNTGRPQKTVTKSRPDAVGEGSDASSIKSTQVASWVRQVRQVRQEALPEFVAETTAKPITEVESYLKSTPWYLKGGYESSDEDMATESVVTLTTENQSKKKEKELPKFRITNDEVVRILAHRNVNPDPSKDGNITWIMNNILNNLDESCGEDEERNWKKDLNKSQVSDEAIFQRTIMMDLINRHQLTDTLEYTCESPWKCPSSIPHRDPELAKRMPMPKPDLTVAFHANSLLTYFQRQDLWKWESIMCPESFKEEKRNRAFHFLSIEVKGAEGTNANWIAHRQNFNTATHALNNIWFFMNKAGKGMVEAFYKTVRFYSVVATGKIFHVRIHRAIELPKGRIEKSYPLGFMFDVIHNHEGYYTKAQATGIIRNILIEYGIKILQPLLSKALEKVWDDLQTASEQSGSADGALANNPVASAAAFNDGASGENVVNEAEQHRTASRATSRQCQEASPISQQKRKTRSVQRQDTSFTRKELEKVVVADGSSPSSESLTPR